MSNIKELTSKLSLSKLAVTMVSIGLIATSPLTVLAANSQYSSMPNAAHTAAKQKATQMWNFHDADIRAIIQMVAKLTGKNLIIDPRVQGKVDFVSTHPMTVDECYKAFLSMLQVLNYTAVPSGDVIKIVPSLNAKSEGLPISSNSNPGSGEQMVVRVVSVNNTSASQLVPILRPMMHDYGSVDSYAPSNSLIFAGEADNINHLVQMVHQLDVQNVSSMQIVSLKHATADKLASAITQLQSAERGEGKVSNVSVVADTQSNSLLISGNPQNRSQVVKLIHRLDDADGKAVGQGAEVIHLNYLTAKDIAPTLSKMVGAGSKGSTAGQKVTIEPENDDNALIVNAPIGVRQNIEKVIRQLDVRPKQVLVEAIIAEVDQNLASKFGVTWGMSSHNVLPNSDSGDNGNGSSSGGSSGSGQWIIKSDGLSAVITAIHNDGNSNILATPMVMALNNKSALMSAGDSISVTNREYADTGSNNDGYNTPFTTTEYKQVPLSLKVTPQISPNNTVRLKLDQEDDSVKAGTGSGDNPDINQNKLTTDVLVKSGHVLVMGGLIKDSRDGSVAKVPILGDIPLLGNLFKTRSKTNEKKDLMIFIRPVIVSNDQQGKKVSSTKYNYMRSLQMKRAMGKSIMPKSAPVMPDNFDQDRVKLPMPFPMAHK